MAESRLRVYFGPEGENSRESLSPGATARDQVTLPLGEILPLLADAVASQRTWLRDFDDDPITISSDLYEVALAYQHYRRPSA
jgi:hypothetical protein